MTASQLVAIKSDDQFENHVREVAQVVLKRPTSSRKRNTEPRLDYYSLELCVVLVNEKIPPQPATSSNPSPTATITATSSTSSLVSDCVGREGDTPTINSELTTTSRKRKNHEVFKFKARKLTINFQAPIETIKRKNEKITAPPNGRPSKDIQYLIRLPCCMSPIA